MTTHTPLRIDFVSDVACPWCAIGLASLQQALTRLDGTVDAEIHLQPFEVNPQLPPEGEDANDRQMHKYGISEAQLEARRAAIRERAAAFGFAFNTQKGNPWPPTPVSSDMACDVRRLTRPFPSGNGWM